MSKKKVAAVAEPVTPLGGELLPVEWLAREFNVDPRSVRRWMSSGRFAPSIRIGKKRFVRRSALLEWMARRELKQGGAQR